MSGECTSNKKWCTKIEFCMRKPPGCNNISSATLTVGPFLAELDHIHRSCWLCLDWWCFSSCPLLFQEARFGAIRWNSPVRLRTSASAWHEQRYDFVSEGIASRNTHCAHTHVWVCQRTPWEETWNLGANMGQVGLWLLCSSDPRETSSRCGA